jgi:hypothetical protein
MVDTDDSAIWYAIHRLLTNYWADVDGDGAQAHECYLPDGIFEVASRRFQGAEQIRDFYTERSREKSEHNTSSRHLISNLRVFGVDAQHVRSTGVMMLYRGDGGPPVPFTMPPTMIFDFEALCALGADRQWFFQSHVLRVIFDGRKAR